MKTEVHYFSRGGNTKKLADAIAGALGVEAKTVAEALSGPVDLLFLGGSVYGGGVDDAIAHFIDTLTPQLVGRAVVFSSAAVKTSAYPQMKRLLEEKGIPVSEREFHCRGQFALLHRGRPNAEDLSRAAAFAKEFIREPAPAV